MDKNEQWTMKHLGGCLSEAPQNIKNSTYNFKVYKGIPKYMNPVDKAFHIENSKLHFWHGSIAEVIAKVLGFIIGMRMNAFINLRSKL